MRIIKDIRQYSSGSFLRAISTILINPNFHSIILYRLAHLLGKTKVLVVISKILMYINRIVYSVDIDYRADLAGGFVLVHGIGTVIGYDVKTEGNVRVYQGVTLGGNNHKKREVNGRVFSQPWVKENVIIYANATVVGPVILNKDVIVGANTALTKDVKAGKTVYMKAELLTV